MKNKHLVSCPSCGGNAHKIGEIPPAYAFLEIPFEEPVNPGSLYCCAACSLGFRYPCLSEAELIGLYNRLDDSLWDGGRMETALRNDTREIIAELEKLPGKALDVLDVCCYNGLLLSNLLRHMPQKTLRLFGVEPSSPAARQAEKLGVSILGSTLSDVQPQEPRFDVIILVDVFEHIINSAALLRQAAALLRPGGVVLVVTGALDAPFLSQARHMAHYIALPEHVSFLSQKHASWLAANSHLQLTVYRLIYHGQLSDYTRWRLKSLVKSVLSSLLNAGPVKSVVGKRKLPGPLNTIRAAGTFDFRVRPDHALAVWSKAL